MLTGPCLQRPARFIFASLGTRGDVYPLLAIGRGLVERGHEVTLAVPARFQEIVREEGMTHYSLRPHSRTMASHASKGMRNRVRDKIFAAVEDTYRDLLCAAKDSDLLAFPIYVFPGPMAAERLGIPWVVLHAAPCTLHSAYDPPYFPTLPWLHPLQRLSPWVPRIINPLAGLAVRSWSERFHELRTREGFPPQKGELLLGGMRSPWLTLALFSSCIGEKQLDWPKPSVVAGFPFYEEAPCQQSEEITNFFQAGDAPIVATLGSLLSKHRVAFLRSMVEAAQLANRRLLLIAGPDAEELRKTFQSDSLLIVDYVPYSQVFQHACAVVMAASMGPLSHALRAGRPMLLVAAKEALDQPDNALRATRLGVGRKLHLAKATAEKLADHLQQLLANPKYARQAERYADQLRNEDGVSRACDALVAAVAEGKR